VIRAVCRGRRVRPPRITAGNVTEPTLQTATRRECRNLRGWASTSCMCAVPASPRVSTVVGFAASKNRLSEMPYSGSVRFEVDPRCLLATVERGDAASIAGWFELGHGPLGQAVALA
jgi:hypothetical protein